jgi:hypothetical protein
MGPQRKTDHATCDSGMSKAQLLNRDSPKEVKCWTVILAPAGAQRRPQSYDGGTPLLVNLSIQEIAMQRVGWLSVFLSSLMTAVIMNGFEHTLSRQISAYFVAVAAATEEIRGTKYVKYRQRWPITLPSDIAFENAECCAHVSPRRSFSCRYDLVSVFRRCHHAEGAHLSYCQESMSGLLMGTIRNGRPYLRITSWASLYTFPSFCAPYL